jgi:ribosomal protein S18 acetylase RimI-like enzyme
MNIMIEPGVRLAHREQAAIGYWEAFSAKLCYPLGPRIKAIAFIEQVLDPTHAISAVSDRGDFLGVAGFKTPQGAFIGGTFADLAGVYGPFVAVPRAMLLSILERPCAEGTLLMDGIFVESTARGLGVGTALLSAIERHAAACGLSRVRLDVIDNNPRARALYERQGFRGEATQSIGSLRQVFGFGSATTMIKLVEK